MSQFLAITSLASWPTCHYLFTLLVVVLIVGWAALWLEKDERRRRLLARLALRRQQREKREGELAGWDRATGKDVTVYAMRTEDGFEEVDARVIRELQEARRIAPPEWERT